MKHCSLISVVLLSFILLSTHVEGFRVLKRLFGGGGIVGRGGGGKVTGVEGGGAGSNECVCTATGDPHYRTFDGVKFDFMGTCKYILTETVANDECAFSVRAFNTRTGNSQASQTDAIEIVFKNHIFYMGTGFRFMVDGKECRSRAITEGNSLRVFMSGNMMTLFSEECGLLVEWNGHANVHVKLNRNRYGGRVRGLCGNCNGNTGDDIGFTLDGRRALNVVDFANSFLIEGGLGGGHCGVRVRPTGIIGGGGGGGGGGLIRRVIDVTTGGGRRVAPVPVVPVAPQGNTDEEIRRRITTQQRITGGAGGRRVIPIKPVVPRPDENEQEINQKVTTQEITGAGGRRVIPIMPVVPRPDENEQEINQKVTTQEITGAGGRRVTPVIPDRVEVDEVDRGSKQVTTIERGNGRNNKLPNRNKRPGVTKDIQITVTEEAEQHPCQGEWERRVRHMKYCGAFLDPDGPFGACIKQGRVNIDALYQACRYDVCSNRANLEAAHKIVCESVAAFDIECMDQGFDGIKWREAVNCVQKCGPNQVYSANVNPCPASCDTLRDGKCGCCDALPSTEGCECKPGFVLLGTECITPDKCPATKEITLSFKSSKRTLTEDTHTIDKAFDQSSSEELTFGPNGEPLTSKKASSNKGHHKEDKKRKEEKEEKIEANFGGNGDFMKDAGDFMKMFQG